MKAINGKSGPKLPFHLLEELVRNGGENIKKIIVSLVLHDNLCSALWNAEQGSIHR